MTRVVLTLIAALLCTAPSFAQTSKEVNALLKGSKTVNIGRDVNSTVSNDHATISVFSHPKASDKDCKITALLMMKELHQHYKKIVRIDVMFYDPANVSNYRKVEIREGEVDLVDMGKPLTEVLSEISVTKGSVGEKTIRGANRLALTTPYLPPYTRSRTRGQQSSTEFTTFHSTDGEVTLQYPSNWVMQDLGDGIKLTYGIQAQAYLFRMPLPNILGLKLEDLANQQEAAFQRDYKSYRSRLHKTRTCSGKPAIYFEGSGTLNNVETVLRSTIMMSQDRAYCFQMLSANTNESEMDKIYEKMFSSVIVR